MASESGTKQGRKRQEEEREIAAMRGVDQRCPFGPSFFLGQLRGFGRDRCPDPDEGLPVVKLYLADGDVLDVCHIIGASPRWIALAVNETERSSGERPMRTELVPYSLVSRVVIRTTRHEGPHVGFDLGHEPDAPKSRATDADRSENRRRTT